MLFLKKIRELIERCSKVKIVNIRDEVPGTIMSIKVKGMFFDCFICHRVVKVFTHGRVSGLAKVVDLVSCNGIASLDFEVLTLEHFELFEKFIYRKFGRDTTVGYSKNTHKLLALLKDEDTEPKVNMNNKPLIRRGNLTLIRKSE